ncbi:MAG TPA: DinB family protein [Bacteroidia bacterium]|jgi:hypothetical protein|nr:DinB family protein [Bacteroidia bacterium]
MQRAKWTDRKFTFDFPEGWLADILERLRGTEIRIQDMILGMPEKDAEFKPDGKWSVKEHIGHLSDLEDLHEGRIDDFLARKEMLRAADMKNIKTNEANHNSKTLNELLNYFSGRRKQFIERLEKLDDATQVFKSIHPRLQTPMRPVDVAFFTAEHDDHHLADIRGILKKIR